MTALYPFLLAAARVLFRADRNAGYYTLGDLGLILLAIVVLLLLIYLVAARVFRGRGAGLPALVTFIAVLWLFGFDAAARSLPSLPHHLGYLLLGAAGLVASAVLVAWFARRPAALRTVSVFLTLTGTLLVLRYGVGIALDHRREARTVARERGRPAAGRADPRFPAAARPRARRVPHRARRVRQRGGPARRARLRQPAVPRQPPGARLHRARGVEQLRR